VAVSNTDHEVDELAKAAAAAGRPVFIRDDGGHPVAAVFPIDHEAVEDYLLSNAPEFTEGMAEADAAIERGERGTPLAVVLAELEDERSDPARSSWTEADELVERRLAEIERRGDS